MGTTLGFLFGFIVNIQGVPHTSWHKRTELHLSNDTPHERYLLNLGSAPTTRYFGKIKTSTYLYFKKRKYKDTLSSN